MANTDDIEQRLKDLEQRVSKLEKPSVSVRKDFSSFEEQIIQKIDDIGIQHLVVLALKIKSKQSRKDIKSKLEQWEKPIGIWFRGSNFYRRLLKKNLVIVDGKNEKGDEIYSLGMKGIKAVKEITKKYDIT